MVTYFRLLLYILMSFMAPLFMGIVVVMVEITSQLVVRWLHVSTVLVVDAVHLTLTINFCLSS